MEDTKKRLLEALLLHKHSLSQAELNFFNRSFKKHHHIPIFYGMPKVHKSPLKLRPVVSCVSFNAIFSIWLDFRMKQLLHLVPSYNRDSKALLNELKTIHIPPNAKIFTADAMAMYTNIDTTTGVTSIRNLIHTNAEKNPLNFPTDLFLLVLETIINTNIFTFGDTFWHQLNGTAMGTPATPLYLILTLGHHKNSTILHTFHHNLLYYKRYIDDVLGIWINTQDNRWEHFKTTLNQFGNLNGILRN